jgi:hypothetical protein
MHPSSFDKMAVFRRDYLDARQSEPLVIVDLGSADINGSYRPLFAQPAWTYQGVDLVPGENVDVVLKSPYHWREIGTASVDVVISGQTFEHTEFFWETMLEIARVLKPNGLCCIIAPSSGPVHRFPIDCWRFYPDGLRAVARYAGLETLEGRTQWTDLEQYDSESNKWHESVLIARKPPEPLSIRWRRKLRAWLNPYLSVVDWTPQSVVQVYFSSDGIHSEENSVCAHVGRGSWKNVSLILPEGARCALLRIDFMSPIGTIDIASIVVKAPPTTIFTAKSSRDFEQIKTGGHAQRLAHPKFLRIKVTGIDPQLCLPPVATEGDKRLVVEMRVQVRAPGSRGD